MSENAGGVLSPFSKQAAQFTWLIVDVFLLLVVLLFFTFYKEIKEDPQLSQLFRLSLVYTMGHLLFSGLHLLSYHRHDDAQSIARLADKASSYKQFPWWRSYTLYAFKLAWFGGFLYLSIHRGLVPWF